MSRIDHVVIAVRDLKVACELLLGRNGLAAYAAGRILGIGTESFIVPLSPGYIELIGICEEREAVANPLGRSVQAALENAQASFLTWAVHPGDSVQPTADRLGLSANPMKRALPDGGDVTCKVVGLQQALEEPPLPYFVEWVSGEESPDQVHVDHAIDPSGFAWLEVSGDKEKMTGWIQDATLPIHFVEGSPGIQAIGLHTEGEPLILRQPLDFAALPQRQFAEPGLQDVSREGASKGALDHSSSETEGSKEPQSAQNSQPSMLELMLDRVETAIETAAEAVENVAGDIISPRSAPTDEVTTASHSTR